jgi:Ferritin-like domain
LNTLSEKDFQKAGYDAKYYSDLKYIAFDEEQHVKLLTGALTEAGVKPNMACKYKFGFNDVCPLYPPALAHFSNNHRSKASSPYPAFWKASELRPTSVPPASSHRKSISPSPAQF